MVHLTSRPGKTAILFFILLGLLLTLFIVGQKVRLLPQANLKAANIVVNVSVNEGPLVPLWQALAQGGEEKFPFDQIEKEITDLQPKYIRLDHLYDFYDVVKKENQQLIFNWSQLDLVVNQIIKTGAIPFLSLSYLPPVITADNDIVGLPTNWQDWSLVVQKTVEHYSGQNNRNLDNVVYEVWNEPDLFGNWKIGGPKDYRLLYRYAVEGALRAEKVNSFKIGGPGTTAPYKNWVDKFLGYIFDNQLRLDFYSWHKYSLDPQDFLTDIDKVDSWLFKNAGYTLPKYLTEWGSVSENSAFHDTVFDAAHLVATIRVLLQRADLAFTFEIKDGPSPEAKQYWGRWGLLTHQSAGAIVKKPKYQALMFLNQMAGQRIRLSGEGNFVTGFASRSNNIVRIILTNFDPAEKHLETFPITFKNLENGIYSYRETYLTGAGKNSSEIVSGQILSKEVFLTPNNLVLIELTKI